ncbi:hypothetical protein ACTFIV_010949 [Dictyostelium citrinum]
METLFQKTKITNGEPELLPNESIIYKVDNVSIYDGDQKTQYSNGTVMLSTHRVIWVNKDIGLGLLHQLVLNIEALTTGLMGIGSSPKILITLTKRSFRLSFHAGRRDDFLKLYRQSLLNKPSQSPPPNSSTSQTINQPNNNLSNSYQAPLQPPEYQQQLNSYNPYQQQSVQPPQQYNSYNPYQSYVQQQQQQIPQYQQQTSPPNYYQHMQQQQSSSPPLYNSYHSTQQPVPPSYLQHMQQQNQQYQSPTPQYQQINSNSLPSQPPRPNYNLQNFINTSNTLNNNNNNNNNNNSNDCNNSNNTNGFTSNAGIGGIINQMNKKTLENDKLLSESFSDLNILMEKAKDMVTLSEKLKITLEKKTGTSTSTEEEEEFRSFLLEMGIESPVTKKTAKSKYHDQLSKQLSDWIITKNILKQNKGSGNNEMIALSDLYCIFNRARGIELISPDDLYRACLLFESLDLPLRLRKFDSGVIVVQSKDENDEQIAKQILDIINENGPLSAFDLAKINSISLHLAKDQLLTSEKLGKLCRDETVEGNILYHKNIFVD